MKIVERIVTSFQIIALVVFVAYGLLAFEIRKYNKPFMSMEANLSQSGEYCGLLNKTFEPNFTTAICISGKSYQFDYLSLNNQQSTLTVYNINNNKEIFSTPFIFCREVVLPSGNRNPCLYLPNDKIPKGQYRVMIKVVSGISKETPPVKIVAYPVYEFYPLVCYFLLLFFFFFSIVSFVLSLGIKCISSHFIAPSPLTL